MFRMFGAAIGKGGRGAQTEIERGKFQEKTCEESLSEIAKIISTIHVSSFFCFVYNKKRKKKKLFVFIAYT